MRVPRHEPLFEPETIIEAVGDYKTPNQRSELFQTHRKKLSDWCELFSVSETPSEAQIRTQFSAIILRDILGYRGPGEIDAANMRDEAKNDGNKSADIELGLFAKDGREQVKAIIELKSYGTDFNRRPQSNAMSPEEQAFTYAQRHSGLTWVILCDFRTIRLYNYSRGTYFYEAFDLQKSAENEFDFIRLYRCLAFDNLVKTDATMQLLFASSERQQNLSEEFYQMFRNLRTLFCYELQQARPDLDGFTCLSKAQKLLNRFIFVAFCENAVPPLVSRGNINKATTQICFEETPVWLRVISMFKAMNHGSIKWHVPEFNGGLFATDTVIDTAILSENVLEPIQNLINFYFAKNLSVTVLGRIFEKSVTDLEQAKFDRDSIDQAIAELIKRRDESDNQADEANNRAQPEENAPAQTPIRRKQEGIFYTQDDVAKFVIDRTLAPFLDHIRHTLSKNFTETPQENDRQIIWLNDQAEKDFWLAYRDRLSALKILDPSCGSGAFLVMAFDYLQREFTNIEKRLLALQPDSKIKLRRDGDYFGENLLQAAQPSYPIETIILTKILHGADINLEAVEISKLSLWIKTANDRRKLDNIDANFRVGNSLLDDPAQIFPSVMAQGGFDVIIGNPPYVRQERIDYKTELAKSYEIYDSTADLYCYFYERGLQMLKAGGRLGYITSSTFLKTNFGEKLRDYLLKNSQFSSMTDFGDLQFFESATTYPIVISCINQKPGPGHQFDYAKLTEVGRNFTAKDIPAYFEEHHAPFPQDALGRTEWELEQAPQRLLRLKISEGKKKLSEIYGHPTRGITIGLNEAFVINRVTRDRLVRNNERAKSLINPLLRGADVKKWHVDSHDLWLIVIPSGWTRQVLLTEHEKFTEKQAWSALKKALPEIALHLQQFEESAKLRSDKGEFWWELRPCKYYDKLEQNKIIWPHFCNDLKFSIDFNHYYVNNKVYFISSDDYSLIALLNSKPIWYFI
ncbi:MAG: Eco57I restriction-modification methylase domain-containing protein, partial [Alphaproteobacteria bacterium]|nr:Eco57I restriction-modification methylase domain-containing protein [Alphaproteobacteria bacterium]